MELACALWELTLVLQEDPLNLPGCINLRSLTHLARPPTLFPSLMPALWQSCSGVYLSPQKLMGELTAFYSPWALAHSRSLIIICWFELVLNGKQASFLPISLQIRKIFTGSPSKLMRFRCVQKLLLPRLSEIHHRPLSGYQKCPLSPQETC